MLNQKDLKIDLIDVLIIISKNKLKILFLPLAITLGCFFIFSSYQQNYFSSRHNDASANILLTSNEYYTQDELLESFNLLLASSLNYESWSNKDYESSLLLEQEEATSLSGSIKLKQVYVFQKIIFHYSSNKKLNAIISFLKYTSNLLNKNILKEIEIMQTAQFKLKKNAIYENISGLNIAIDALKQTNISYQRKIDFINEYIQSNINVDTIEIAFERMDKQISILENKKLMEVKQNNISEKNKKLKEIISDYNANNLIKDFDEKIIHIGKITTKNRLKTSISLQAYFIISLFIFLILTVLSISIVIIANQYNIRKKNS